MLASRASHSQANQIIMQITVRRAGSGGWDLNSGHGRCLNSDSLGLRSLEYYSE